jgi:psp operon transcriptional activator
MASELRHSFFPGFSPKAASTLLRHQWPGNVRELKNTIERSVYRSENPEALISKIAFDPFDSPFKLADIDRPAQQKIEPGRAPLLPTDLSLRLNDIEREFLEAALAGAHFNQRIAADLLGLSYHQFRGKLRKHDLSGRPGA